MAKKKYYAVRKGIQTGIFLTWDACKQQINGVSGAEFKSFGTEEEARAYLGLADSRQEAGNSGERQENSRKEAKNSGEEGGDAGQGAASSGETTVEAYVDGSYCLETKEFSYGMVILRDGKEYRFSQKVEDKELARMRNVAGEIKGAEAAMQYALDQNIGRIIIYHDYEGIAKWCTRAWQANKAGTQAYRDFYDAAKEKVKIEFVKVTGHSNNKYNDLADQLAKEALGL